MMMSLILTVGFFSLFLLPLTCISILLSLRSDPLQRHLSSTAAKLAGSICKLLLRHTLFPFLSASRINEDGRNDVVGARSHSGSREECRVCLSEVEQGEEIGGLRCRHVFHKVCLDAWVNTGHATCPLCRGRVFSLAVAGVDGGSELILFRFCSSRRRAATEDGWWLR